MTDMDELKASLRPLKRHRALWSFQPIRQDEIPLESGDVVLVAMEYEDGWSRGMKLETKEVGFFPSSYVKPAESPIRSYQASTSQMKMSDIDLKFAAKDPARRAKVVLELYTSEKEYCERLRILHETFVIPLGKFSVMNPQDYSVVFSRIAPMLNLAEEMRVNLESRTEAWHDPSTLVGDLFLYKENEMMELFVSYASKHVIGQKALEHLRSNDKFMTWLAKAEHQCNRTLNALMIEAIQRPPRYVLLLQDLLSSTQRDHPDYLNLEAAVQVVSEVTQECNQKTKRMQAELALLMIGKQFPYDEVDLTGKKHEKPDKSRRSRYSRQVMDPAELEPTTGFEDKTAYASFFHSSTGCRELVREGTLMRGKSNFTDLSERYVFLLTDVLLVAQPISLKKKAYRLKDRVPLVQAWVTDQLVEGVRVPENAFVLGTPHDVHRFVANSQNSRLWFNDLRKLIFEQKKAFSELLTHLTLPDEVYYTVKAKVALPYLAMGADELTLKREDAVSVVGFLDSGGTWQAGLYSSKEMFDPSNEWFFGCVSKNFGWFPKGCVKLKRPEANTELPALPVAKVFEIRKQMLIKSRRALVASASDQERFVKVAAAEGQVVKTIPLEPTTTVTDIVKRFHPTKDAECFNWLLIETSRDRTIERVVPPDENLCLCVDFWGKMRSQMRFQLQQGNVIE